MGDYFVMNMNAITVVALFLGVASPGVFAEKWKNGVAGCYSGPPSCESPQADELAILVTGGNGADTSAEVLFTNGSSICELPQMPQSKFGHTQSGLTACGGSFSDNHRNCIKFEDGSWITLTDNLVEE